MPILSGWSTSNIAKETVHIPFSQPLFLKPIMPETGIHADISIRLVHERVIYLKTSASQLWLVAFATSS